MERITFFLGFFLMFRILFVTAQTRQDTLGIKQAAPEYIESQHHFEVMQSGVKSDPFIRELDSIVTGYNYYNPVEKVYLHVDRDLISSGENLWYKAYTVLGAYHQFSLASKVIHVDLIGLNSKILVSQTHELFDGKANGSIALPKNLSSGNYQLRAYTNWMRNFDANFFFTKMIKVVGETDIPVLSKYISDKIDLQFFPEGGHAVVDLLGQVAFKAIGSDGLDREVLGYIKDSQGKPVVHFSTLTRGSGFFYLQPKFGEIYTATLDDGSEYPFPKIMNQGYAMTINSTGQQNIKIKIEATELLRRNPFYIIGQVNNKKYFQGKYEFKNKEAVRFEIPKKGFPSGVLTFTLFDQNKKPWCERVVFINNQEGLVINARISPEKISKRNEIAVDVTVTDTYGEPVSTELSMAITDAGQVVKNPNSRNILTYLLLQSDIKGLIENPGFLFKDQNRLTLYALDLVMLTHGWRKFPWQEIQEKSLPIKEFDFAKGLTMSGQARSKIDKRLKNTDLNLITKSGDIVGMLSTKTDRDGKFSIPNFNFIGTTRVIFNAMSSSKTAMNVKVALDDHQISIPPSHFKSPIRMGNSKEATTYADYSSTRKNMRLLYDYENTIELDEVVVTEKIEKTIAPISKFPFGQVLSTKDTPETQRLMTFIMRFGGLTLDRNNKVVTMRSRGSPGWILDDRPGTPVQIASMDISNIAWVEYLKPPSSFGYGKRGAHGIFIVHNKKGARGFRVLSPDFEVMGHAAEREFYSPNYSIKQDRHSVPDYRATLYWNPSLRTDNSGNARLLFHNSDNAKQLQVAIEGLSDNGTPGAYVATFGSMD